MPGFLVGALRTEAHVLELKNCGTLNGKYVGA